MEHTHNSLVTSEEEEEEEEEEVEVEEAVPAPAGAIKRFKLGSSTFVTFRFCSSNFSFFLASLFSLSTLLLW